MIRFAKSLLAKEDGRNRVVWGIRVDRGIKKRCDQVAALAGVPVGLLVSFIFDCWFYEHIDLLKSEETIKGVAKQVQVYNRRLNRRRSRTNVRLHLTDDEIVNLGTRWSIRGISIETRVRIKAMALNRGIPVYRMIDEIVSKEWEREGNKPGRPRISRRLGKEVRRLLYNL